MTPRVGEEIPPLVVTPGAAQLFFFSAAAYNGHRIHYDRSWAVDVEEHPGVVIQGALQSALLARVVTDWIGPAGRLERFACCNRGAAYVDQTLTFRGTVTAVHPGAGGDVVVDLDLRGEGPDGTVLMPGSATVRIGTRS